MRLKDKVAIITGGSKGIGAGTCEVFCEEGAHVFVIARNQEGIDAMVKELRDKGGKATGISCDVGKSDAVNAMVDQVVAEAGRIEQPVGSKNLPDLRRHCRWYPVLCQNSAGWFFPV